MDPYQPRKSTNQEFKIQGLWTEFLHHKGWLVERMIGNAFQMGIPDLFIAHKEHGQRWIDIKVYGKYSFTKAQKKKWPIWDKHGIGIWILGASSKKDCTKELMLTEYKKLFEPPNWKDFWKDSWNEECDIDAMLRELDDAS